MKTLPCPHCKQGIDVLEPSDLDDLGINQNKRAEAVKNGALKPWAALRAGKLFLYLKRDVDTYLEGKQFDTVRKELKRRNPDIDVWSLTPEDLTTWRELEESRIRREEEFLRKIEERSSESSPPQAG